MKSILLMSAALLIGGLIPLQGSINSQLGKSMNHPLQATFISFLGGTVMLVALLLVIRPEIPPVATLKGMPWYLFTGGFLGVIFVTMVIMLAPRIGIANTLAAAIAGQLLMSVVFDHFGWLGLSQHPVTWPRLAGCLGLIVSLVLIQKA